MRRESRSGLALLALGLVLALTGCGGAQAPEDQEGSAQAVVTMPQALSASDVSRVELTLSGAGMTTRTEALVKSGGQWRSVLGQLPAGTGRTFSAKAFDSSNTERYAGQATPVTILANQTTAVTLLLQEVNAPPPFENVAPRILSLVTNPGTVAPGGQVSLQATADDPNAGDTLTYAWTASSGTLGAPSSLTTAWTAPATAGQATLTLTVTDSKGASTSLSVTVTVSTGNGGAGVSVSFNTWPQVAGITAMPSSVAVGQATTVMASASDADGDSLTYQWTANCAGTWTNADSANASFTPTALPSGGTCTLNVKAQDGREGQGTGSFTIHVTATPTTGRFPPEVFESSQSTASVPASGDTVLFRVRARDAQSSALTFAWTASTGALGTATSTATTSDVVWTAPACVASGNPPTVTATVTNALGLSASYVFSLQGGTACSAATGPRMAGGDSHSVIVKPDGTVWSLGTNGNGQLGDGTQTERRTPVRAQGLTGVLSVATGDFYTVAVKSDGTVWVWGSNNFGQLGDGTTTDRLTPVQVPGLTGVIAIAAGDAYTVALKSDGTVWTWGYNGYGQLGNGTTAGRLSPGQVPGLTGVVSIAAGGTGHTLAAKSDGTVWAWGRNGPGQVGDGTSTSRSSPVQVLGVSGVVTVAAGDFHSLGLKSDGTVWGWGYNGPGQLGDGTGGDHPTAVRMPGMTGVAAIAAGDAHTVLLKSDGTVWTCGYNANGQVGDGTTTNRSTPAQVPGLTGVVAIGGGDLHSMALKSDATLWSWGGNAGGQLGDGTSTGRGTPVRAQGF
ncbi:RCC1 domain-containing protein [Corallococcus carmarthensis]|uniref:RCC1 domain-containing protein n=1 Tax=Corallococcus carmarthensis TaxID=2316728 RepID=UPI00148D6E54|nr:PKD domain-containing protein [Corallococcus carmarthensis]NOK16163.1 kelch-like protein [Corallococcus carmarthensis]